MEVTLPLIPAGVSLLLAFLAPYAIAVINHPAWNPTHKKLVALVVTVLLAGVSMLLDVLITGQELPNPVQYILLFLVVSQAAYALIFKSSAKALEAAVGPRHRVEGNSPSVG